MMKRKRKIYRNIYIKFFKEIPYPIMKGRITISYYGQLIFDYDTLPASYDPGQDMEITCNCDLEEIKDFKRVEKI